MSPKKNFCGEKKKRKLPHLKTKHVVLEKAIKRSSRAKSNLFLKVFVKTEMLKLFALLATICSCHAYTRFTKCGTPNDNYVMSVKMGDCRKPPCTYKKGTNMTVEIDFYSSHSAEGLRMLYYSILQVDGTETVKVGPMEGPGYLDACVGDGIECPIKAAGRYLYKKTFHIDADSPTLRDVVAEVKLISIGSRSKNYVARQVFCIQYPFEIVD